MISVVDCGIDDVDSAGLDGFENSRFHLAVGSGLESPKVRSNAEGRKMEVDKFSKMLRVDRLGLDSYFGETESSICGRRICSQICSTLQMKRRDLV